MGTAVVVLLSARIALADPIYTFTTSTGVEPSTVGTITLSQVNSTTVDVLLDLSDTTLPLPEYGILNTGGPHTPFAFTIAGSESGVSATFIQPSGGTYTMGTFSLDLTGGSATPFGSFGAAIDLSAGLGSGDAYYGDFEFQLTRTSGLTADDFIANANSVYFAADLTDGRSNTGSQAWLIRTTVPPVCSTDCGHIAVPEPGSLTLLGGGLIGLGLLAAFRRRRGDGRSTMA